MLCLVNLNNKDKTIKKQFYESTTNDFYIVTISNSKYLMFMVYSYRNKIKNYLFVFT